MATTCTSGALAVNSCGTVFNSNRPRREQLLILLLDLTSNNTVEELDTYLTENSAKLGVIECMGTSAIVTRQATWIAALVGQTTLPQVKCLSGEELEALILSLLCDLYNVVNP